jgi:hypothetical protein
MGTVYGFRVKRFVLGGWRLQLYEDDVEVGGGVFSDSDYLVALSQDEEWLFSRISSPLKTETTLFLGAKLAR